MLILKQNAANSVPTPPAGKGTIFLDDSDTLSVKTSDGNVETFPTVAASNAQVVFMNGTSLSGEAALTYNFNTNVLNVSGNVAAGNVLTNNLLYANGSAWELGNVGGSDTQIQFNDNGSFGGDSGFTYNKTTDAATLAGTMTAGNLSTGGTVTATGNVSGGNLTTAGLVNATGNVTGGNLTTAGKVVASTLESNVSTGTAPFVVASTTQVANLNAATAGTAGTVTTAAQPNITSVGNLTALVMAGNLTPATDDTYDLGNTTHRFKDIWLSGNSIRLGGATISANATAVTITNPQGGNTSFTGSTTSNNSSIVNGTSNVVAAASGNVTTSVNGTANVFTVTSTGANVAGYANITGNANVGNLGTGGLITATGNVSGGNLTTAGVVAATGNVSGGNLTTAGVVAATGNVSGGNLTTAGVVAATGNVSGGNLTTAGVVAATGNVSGGNLTTAGVVAATGNVTTAAQLVSSVSTGTAPLVVTSTTRVANLDVAKAGVANTVNDAAQPNITSVGTLSSLGVSGTITAANLTANTGVFTGNGAGLTNIPGANIVGNISGNISNANYSAFAGQVVDSAQSNITSVGTLSSLSVSGNASAGNLNTAGKVVASTLESNVAAGTAPFVVVSTTRVANLDVAKAGVANTVNDASQPNITSVGTLTSLAVTGNATAGNVYANAGTIGASLLTGTLTTASQPNITSVGTLSSLTATGNVAAGNLTTTGVLSVTGTGVSSIAGNLDMTSNTIINLATPTNPTDAATKQYVDDVAQGLNVHDSCQAATPDTLANITSGTITYNNGTAGVGAYITTSGTFNLIDGVNVQTAGTRILVKNEANAVLNGIYTYTNTTAITRAVDFDSIPEVEAGDFTFITGGTLYDNTGWVQTESPTGIGTAGNNISFTQFSGAGTYNAGTGLTLTGSTFSVNASQTQITTVGTLGSLSVTANVTAGNVYANSGTIGASLLTGTLTTASQPNVTSLGTLTGLGVNGTVTAVNFTANTGVFTGNGAALTNLTGGNVTGQVANALVAGTVYTASQPNITSVGTLTSLTVTGNASAGNISTGGVLSVTGNANVGNLGTAGLIVATGNVTGGNLVTSGALSVTGNANVGNLGTAGLIVATGNVSGGNVNATSAVVASTLTSNVATGTAPLTVTSTTRVANLNVAYANVADNINLADVSTGTYYPVLANAATGNVSEGSNSALTFNAATGALSSTSFSGALNGPHNGTVGATTPNTGAFTTISASGQITSTVATGSAPFVVSSTTQVANLNVATAGTVTTAAQPNITSVGTLTSLGVSGTITAANITANTGVFTGNGSGLSQLAGANVVGTINSTTLGNSSLFVGTTSIALNRASASQSLTGITSIDGYAATVSTAAQPNITSVGTLTSLNVSGNITAPNVIANTGYHFRSVNAAVSAAGTVQGNATAIAREVNVVSTVASGAGVVLPTAVAGMCVHLINTAANSLLVYPASGGKINALATDAAFTMPASSNMLQFIAISATQWYTAGATYA